MKLSETEYRVFLATQQGLYNFIIRDLKLLHPNQNADGYLFEDKDYEFMHEKIFHDPTIIDKFIQENPYNLTQIHLDLATSWKTSIKGTFWVYKELKNYTIFIDEQEPPKIYGVLGLWDEIQTVIPMPYPALVETYLIPFQNRIIYHGFFHYYRILFGAGVKKRLNDTYRTAKAQNGIITQFPS
jgi:hypothetical protein